MPAPPREGGGVVAMRWPATSAQSGARTLTSYFVRSSRPHTGPVELAARVRARPTSPV